MTTPAHTPEPRWRLVRQIERVWIDRNGEAVISLLWSPQAADLLARIVDDHNTLAGLTDPAAQLAELVAKATAATGSLTEGLDEVLRGTTVDGALRDLRAALAPFQERTP